jgi:hypothetical protein
MRNEIYKEQRKNKTLYMLNISQNMFICLESMLLIAVRGFISIFLCMWHDLSKMGTSELLRLARYFVFDVYTGQQAHPCMI